VGSSSALDQITSLEVLCKKKWENISFFLATSSPSAFDWMGSAEDLPFKNTRPFGSENTPSHFVSWAANSDTPEL